MFVQRILAASFVCLCVAAQAPAAITEQGRLWVPQRGTPAPDGFDPGLAIMEDGYAFIADEPNTHEPWVGVPFWTGNGDQRVSYYFGIQGHDIYFTPFTTQVGDMGCAVMTQYYLWEPVPADFQPSTYMVSGNGPFPTGYRGVLDPSVSLPEPALLAPLIAGTAALSRRRRPGAPNRNSVGPAVPATSSDLPTRPAR